MLSVSKIGGGAAAAYYANLAEHESVVGSYYSEDDRRQGVWFGGAAACLGLSGEVDAEAFQNLLDGKSPDGQTDLVQQRSGERLKRRAGFDLTFSLPKSYSVLYSQVSDARRAELDRVVGQVVCKTLDLVEAECGRSRRGKNGVVVEEAKLVAALFKHDTARGLPGEVPDCNVHYHAVVANVAQRPDGSYGTLDARALFERRKKVALGTMFRAEVTKRLKAELGIETFRPEKPGRPGERVSWFEVAGVPKTLIEAMSKRRCQIEAWLREHGLSGAKAAERANLGTRTKKERFAWQTLSDTWLELGRQHGWSRDEADRLVGRSRDEDTPQKSTEQLAAQSLSMLMYNRARFTRNELLERAATEAQTTGLGIGDVLAAAGLNLANNRDIVRLQDKKGLATYTTREMLRIEKELLEAGKRLAARREHEVNLGDVARGIINHPTIRRDQAEAVQAVCTGGDCVSVTGIAGSGKTFMLGVAREVLEREGYELLGTALAADAAKELEKGSGIRSTHLHKLLFDLKDQAVRLTDKSLIVLDEAGMVGSRQCHELLGHVERAGAKLVMVGDPKQLQPVESGAPFRAISEAVRTTELGEIIRQREGYARQMVYDLRAGKAQDALAELDKRGQLVIAEQADDARKQLIARWEQLLFEQGVPKSEVLVLCGMNESVREINRSLQAVCRTRGELGDYRVEVDGIGISLGDRVVVTRNHRLMGLRNGERGEVVGASEKTLWVKLESGFEVEVDTEAFPHLTLAYAATVHRSQGKSVEHTLYLTGDVMTALESAYVAGSRARDKTFVYSHTAAVESVEGLAAMMNESRPNEQASDFVLERV